MKRILLPLLLLCGAAFGQTAGTVYQATVAGKAILGSPFASLSAATTAETAAGPGTYTNTPYTTAAGTATTFVVSAPVQSASGTTLIPPTTAVITDAKGNTWGLVGGQVTLNGKADATTAKVIEMAYVISAGVGTVWQESTAVTPSRWWGTTVAPASWLPAGGTTTSPIAVTCGAAPASTTATIQCPVSSTGSWQQTTTYASAASPVCWTPVLSPTAAPAGACTAVVTGTATRPSYNTGNGFFVLNGKLYDANGNQFVIRGVDRAHYDDAPQPGLSLTKANAARVLSTNQYGASDATLVADLQKYHVAYGEVPIPMFTDWGSGTDTSCNSSPSALTSTVAHWVSAAAQWTTLNKYSIVNIANEWGPSNSTVWRDSNISAIASMRAAGYLGTLMVDSGGCGQDINDLVNYSAAVEAADSQHNVVFSWHVYGLSQTYPPGSTIAQINAGLVQLAALQKSGAAVFVIGEFGPGNGIGPSPTNLSPLDLTAAADANGIGWMAWAWDDNNLSNCMANNSWFSMTVTCGVWSGGALPSTQLTNFGNQIVPLLETAKPASIFSASAVKAASAKLTIKPLRPSHPSPKTFH